jgi:hypothetical protein
MIKKYDRKGGKCTWWEVSKYYYRLLHRLALRKSKRTLLGARLACFVLTLMLGNLAGNKQAMQHIRQLKGTVALARSSTRPAQVRCTKDRLITCIVAQQVETLVQEAVACNGKRKTKDGFAAETQFGRMTGRRAAAVVTTNTTKAGVSLGVLDETHTVAVRLHTRKAQRANACERLIQA